MFFEGSKGNGAQGDIAIDDILITKLGTADPNPTYLEHGLPIQCNFEVSIVGYLKPGQI